VRINAIKKQKKLLEEKVEEQTAELKISNQQERMARKEADRANEQLEKKNVELEQFVYIASHDLREPLRTTAGFVELLQRQYGEKLDEKAKNYLGFITQSTERMRILINDLLEYSRIGAEREKQKVQVGEVVANVIADLGSAIAESKANIAVDPMPIVNGYPTAIKQLFQNLIANAIKFKRKEVAPQIDIRVEEDSNEWKFSIADNGIGISEQHRKRIFMIFQRLHHRKEYEGSGIGLAHCKKIVEMHNGNLWMEPNERNGSVFYFTIPK
jgi:light-regulated signal transduction histidine kinase (bacteriophytochrome)